MFLFRKRGRKFPERNKAVLSLFSALLEPSRSVYESNCFPERPVQNRGAVFGIKNFQKPLAEIRWATLSRRGSFNPEDGFVACLRQSASLPSGDRKRKKAEVVPFRTASASCHFQSLKMSSNAKSRAVFMLFYMKDRISASSTDFFFFFLSLSFFLSLISTSPRW